MQSPLPLPPVSFGSLDAQFVYWPAMAEPPVVAGPSQAESWLLAQFLSYQDPPTYIARQSSFER